MSANAVTICHSLELVPTNSVRYFGRIGAVVRMALNIGRNSTPSGAIPGTITVSQSAKSGLISKTINYETGGRSAATENVLRGLSLLPLVAVYVDETGNRKICGSPSYPLRLEYARSEGGYSVTLTGKDNEPDGFAAG